MSTQTTGASSLDLLAAVAAANALARLLCEAPRSPYRWEEDELGGVFEVARIIHENLQKEARRAERLLDQMASELDASHQGRGGEASARPTVSLPIAHR